MDTTYSKPKIPQCWNCIHFEQVTKKYGKCDSVGKPDNFRFSYNGRNLYPLVATFGVCDQHKTKDNIITKANVVDELNAL